MCAAVQGILIPFLNPRNHFHTCTAVTEPNWAQRTCTWYVFLLMVIRPHTRWASRKSGVYRCLWCQKWNSAIISQFGQLPNGFCLKLNHLKWFMNDSWAKKKKLNHASDPSLHISIRQNVISNTISSLYAKVEWILRDFGFQGKKKIYAHFVESTSNVHHDRPPLEQNHNTF